MSDKKISQLQELTTTPDSTDVLPIVNSGETKKVTVQNLLSGVSGNGLPAGSEFNIILAGQTAPDGELYYCIDTDQGVPIQQGELIGVQINKWDLFSKSKARIDHALSIPVPGWKQVSLNTSQINDSVFLDSIMQIVAVSESGKILKSYDAGQTWHEKYQDTNPIKKLYFTGSVASTSSKTSRNGYLAAIGGRKFYQSSDQGETWTEYDADSILSPNEQFIAIKEKVGSLYLLGNLGALVSVNITSAPISVTLQSSLPTSIDYTGLEIVTDIISGNDIFYAIGNSDAGGVFTGHLFKSISSPFNWVDIYSQTNQKFYGILFTDIDNGFVVGAKDINTTSTGVIHRTIDACQNWDIPDITALSSGILKDITSFETTIWIAGHNSTILKSSDGAIWTKADSFINDQGLGHNLISICVYDNIANVTGDEADPSPGIGYYYYYFPDVYDGVQYSFTPVDTLWIKILQPNGVTYKHGFVCALNVTI